MPVLERRGLQFRRQIYSHAEKHGESVAAIAVIDGLLEKSVQASNMGVYGPAATKSALLAHLAKAGLNLPVLPVQLLGADMLEC